MSLAGYAQSEEECEARLFRAVYPHDPERFFQWAKRKRPLALFVAAARYTEEGEPVSLLKLIQSWKRRLRGRKRPSRRTTGKAQPIGLADDFEKRTTIEGGCLPISGGA